MVSVIIPIYNTEIYLEECIQSVVNQTYRELEIILINDGSTDNSGLICKKWKKLDHRIQYIEKENEGQGIARNLGITQATGEYIIFVDSDDYLDENLIRKAYNYISEQNADICMYAINYVGDKIDKETLEFKIYQGDSAEKNKEIFGRLRPFLWEKMFSSSLIKNEKITMSNRICEDLVFNAQLYVKAKKICILDIPLYYYRYKRDGNLSADYYRCFEIEQSIDELMAIFKRNNWFESYWIPLYRISFERFKDALFRMTKRTDLEIPIEIRNQYTQFFTVYRDCLKKWFSSYVNFDLQEKNFLLVGSYNLRVIIHSLLLNEDFLKRDYGSSSIISLMSNYASKEMPVKTSKFKNIYRKRCVQQDIEKDFCQKEDFQEIDYLVIDLLEEILNLIKINNDCYITESEFLQESELQESQKYERILFFSEERRRLFKKYVVLFAEKIKVQNIPVIVIKNFLCKNHSIYYDKFVQYENAEKIDKANIELEWYYQQLLISLPDVVVVDSSAFRELEFTHDNFLFGCKPIYYNTGYYQRMAIQLSQCLHTA